MLAYSAGEQQQEVVESMNIKELSFMSEIPKLLIHWMQNTGIFVHLYIDLFYLSILNNVRKTLLKKLC